MSVAAEVTVAGLNAYNAFDPSRSAKHQELGFYAIEALGSDVDVLCIPETTGPDADEMHLDMIRSGMNDLGYNEGLITTGVRPDNLNMSLWTRIEGEMRFLDLGGGRNLPMIRIPGFGNVVGIHNPSDSEVARVAVSRGIVRHASNGSGQARETVVVGDFNATYETDLNTRKLRAADYITRWAPRVVDINYASENKWVHKAGVVIRGCAMVRGHTMRILTEAGFRDADPGYQPTVFYGAHALRIDHVIASSDIDLEDFEVMPRISNENGEPITDHASVKSRARKRQFAEALDRI